MHNMYKKLSTLKENNLNEDDTETAQFHTMLLDSKEDLLQVVHLLQKFDLCRNDRRASKHTVCYENCILLLFVGMCKGYHRIRF